VAALNSGQRAREPGAGRSARGASTAPQAQVERMRGALKMAEANALEMKRREQELTTRAPKSPARGSIAQIDSQLADTIAVRRWMAWCW
jgi:hypothetical protein